MTKLTPENIKTGLKVKIVNKRSGLTRVGEIMEMDYAVFEDIKKRNPGMTITIHQFPHLLMIARSIFCLIRIEGKRTAIAMSRVYLIPEELTNEQKDNLNQLILNLKNL